MATTTLNISLVSKSDFFKFFYNLRFSQLNFWRQYPVINLRKKAELSFVEKVLLSQLLWRLKQKDHTFKGLSGLQNEFKASPIA